MPIFLLVEAAAVITITVWPRRPGWGDRQILALAAGALFAYAWHAFTTTPAFDTAPMVVVRISNVVFAALALIAVVIAARRIATADRLEKGELTPACCRLVQRSDRECRIPRT